MKTRTISRWPFADWPLIAKWCFAAFLLAAATCLFWSSPALADDDDGDAVSGEIVIKFNSDAPGTNDQKIQAVYRDYPEIDANRTETLLSSSGIYLLRLNNPDATEAVIERMENDTAAGLNGQQVPRFRYVEPNFTTDTPEGNPRRHHARGEGEAIPSTDPAPYSNQYAIDMLDLSCAQQTNGGEGTTVAVLDTGIQSDHPELSESLVPGYNFIDDNGNPADSGNGVDDDGDGDVDEMVGHGTHVAGIVHLTAPDAEIMPMKVLDSDGTGNVFVIAEAVQRAVANDADVINMSLGSSGESDLLEDIVEDLAREVEYDDGAIEEDDDDDSAITGVPPRGVAVVASAGNENVQAEHYPAAHDEAVSVASIGEDKVKSEFSNFGTWVDVAAPGEEIHSLFPTSRYASWDGTSMAAPFVAGQAAILRSMNPDMPTLIEEDDEVRNPPPSVVGVIRDTAASLDAANPSHAGLLGKGLINVGASVKKLDPNASCGGSAQPNASPAITNFSPAPGSKTKNQRPLISATVEDDASLAKSGVSLFVDGGRKTGFAYDAATGKLTYRSSRLAPKKHSVKIVARDSQGLSSTKTWQFTVTRR